MEEEKLDRETAAAEVVAACDGPLSILHAAEGRILDPEGISIETWKSVSKGERTDYPKTVRQMQNV